MSRCSFDYLFSIVNSRILPKNLLELPGRHAINYHDALLPKYAASHATSWAIMQREDDPWVTWHEMTDLINAGNILQQCSLDIADDETAFTLNAKCYDTAIRSFAELVEDLSSDRASVRKQHPDKRSSFRGTETRCGMRCLTGNGQPMISMPSFALWTSDVIPTHWSLRSRQGKSVLHRTKVAVLDSTSDTPLGPLQP